MGKYMRKSKRNNSPEVSINLMEITPQKSPLGVRTRAKTLALQSTTTATTAAANTTVSSLGYLQLRSRRLLRFKPPVYKEPRRLTPNSRDRVVVDGKGTVSPNPNLCNSSSSSPNSGVRASPCREEEFIGGDGAKAPLVDDHVEEVDACCGENVVDSDPKERSTRESTPINLIRDPDSIHTPGSTTRPTSSAAAGRRLQSSTQTHIPSSQEMEEFFAGAEDQQQKEFVEKYNFDPVNDKPLPGRYEWEKVKPPGGH